MKTEEQQLVQDVFDVLVVAGVPVDGPRPAYKGRTGAFWRALGQVAPWADNLRGRRATPMVPARKSP